MKKCNTELMKEIKILEEKKNDILTLEEEECKITYLEGEKKMDSNYSYDAVRKEIDEIAEHILTIGGQPLGTMEDFIKNSEIQEAKNEKIKSMPIIKNVLQDLNSLKQKALKIKQEAEKNQDYATSALMDKYLENYAKKIWMLNETSK